jgi:hypothetical protein
MPKPTIKTTRKLTPDSTVFKAYRRDPSPRRNAGGNSQRWFEVLKPLLKSPGQWFVIAETSDEAYIPSLRTRATPLKKRMLIIPRPDDVWDFCFRTEYEPQDEGDPIAIGRLYAMYVGAKEEEE